MSNSHFGSSDSGHPTEFATIFPPDPQWLATQEQEEVLLPDLPIVDAHHHLWNVPGYRYLAEDLVGDLDSGHRVVDTVYVEAMTGHRPDGPVELRPVGDTEFVVRETPVAGPGGDRLAQAVVAFADLA